MNYNHLTIEERACICKFKQMNMKIREIAKLLDRSPSTISRELKRNSYKKGIHYSTTAYSPLLAQKKYNERRKECHRKIKINDEIKKYLVTIKPGRTYPRKKMHSMNKYRHNLRKNC